MSTQIFQDVRRYKVFSSQQVVEPFAARSAGLFGQRESGENLLGRTARQGCSRPVVPSLSGIVVGLALILVFDCFAYVLLFRINHKEDLHDGAIAVLASGVRDESVALGATNQRLDSVTQSITQDGRRVEHLSRLVASQQLVTETLSSRLSRFQVELSALSRLIEQEMPSRSPSQASVLADEEFRFDSTIPIVANAVVHRSAGKADYWVIKRDATGKAAHVIPFADSGYGVLVHCLDDGREYILTHDGMWGSF